jgi:hypothetical protein
LSGPNTAAIANPASASSPVSNLVQGTYSFKLVVTDNSNATASATVSVTINPAVTTNQPPVSKAGDDITITLPANSVTLNGTNSYDPDGSLYGYQWTKLSGPAQFTFGDSNGGITTFSNLVQGTYTLKLRVWDNLWTPSDDTINIIVKGASTNQPPVANAGSNIIITLPTSGTALNGTGSSDPDGFISKYSWSQVSGPNTATISSASSATPGISNLVQGTYTFKLVVTDNSNATSSATVSVTVNPASSNKPPVSIAGPDITLRLPTNSATIDGTTSYDPDGSLYGYRWSKLSGPAQFAFGDSNGGKTSFYNLVQGKYVLRLRVWDNLWTPGDDTIVITVNSAPTQPGTLGSVNLIGNLISLETLTVFPNPSSGEINIRMNKRLSGVGRMNVYDGFGRLMLSRPFIKVQGNEKQTLNVYNLKPGVYRLEMLLNNKKQWTTFIRR